MLDEIARTLGQARCVTVLTGAGVSAESGIPTFRDALAGLWARYDPQALATPEGFARDPALVARWYDERRLACAGCRPNPGHYALAEIERRITQAGGAFVLITQNVDRLHQRAGSRNVVELHGTIWVWRCIACGTEREEAGEGFGTYPPRCDCGGLRRPAVVWFGELLPSRALARAQAALETCDTFLALGTSATVEPAASFVHVVRARGAHIIEINLETTPASDAADYTVRGRTGEILPQIAHRLQASRG